MSTEIKDMPIGIKIIQRITDKCCPRRTFNRNLWYRSSVLVLTFIAYMTYHASRKPISVVKAILHRNCSALDPGDIIIDDTNRDTWCDWAPFNADNASQLLGTLDSSFLFAYGAAMFMSGFVAERVSLRYFLALGMIFSGISSYLLGIAHNYQIHSLWYFVLVQIFGGIMQTTGWPGVVAVMGNWFGKGKRGLIFGVWNSHTSIGNVLGTLVAAHYAEYDWGLSFIVPGVIIASAGFIVFLFLVPDPSDVNCVIPEQNRPEIKDRTIIQMAKLSSSSTSVNEVSRSRHVRKRRENGSVRFKNKSKVQTRSIPITTKPLRQFLKSFKNVVHLNQENNNTQVNSSYERLPTTEYEDEGVGCDDVDSLDNSDDEQKEGRRNNEDSPILIPDTAPKAVGFLGALKIPGVVEFSLCLFFAKLVSYTFLYWLPQYITYSTTLSVEHSADLSTVFDFGGIAGGIAAGMISDYSGMSATTCSVMLFIAVPVLFIYNLYGAANIVLNTSLLIVSGILVNGPYALITTAVSAELGTHHSLKGNSKALATVTSIIDGTGSIGAAVGPFLAGVVSRWGWGKVFYMLMLSDVIALLLLTRLVYREISQLRRPARPQPWEP